jgi:hypothetical protein
MHLVIKKILCLALVIFIITIITIIILIIFNCQTTNDENTTYLKNINPIEMENTMIHPYDDSPKYNLAFYTCFYGVKSNIAFKIPELPSNNYDCYFFSNNTEMLLTLKFTNWISIFDDKPITTDEVISSMNSKHLKSLPEDFTVLKKYDYLCYLDSKVKKINETFVENLIKKYFIDKNYALLIRTHDFLKGFVWDEYKESMLQSRYRSEKHKYKKYIEEQKNAGLSETTEKHAMTGFLIRNMRNPNTIILDKKWYTHIQKCGIQCQISFFFIKQMFVNDILIFDESPY